MNSIPLSTLANLAEIIGAGSIITGLLFGWFQIRHFREQQRNAVAINLMQTFYDQDLADAIATLQPVPDGLGLEEIRELGPEFMRAAITVTTSFETMGLLVFKRIATIDLVLDLAGGIVITMSRKVASLAETSFARHSKQPSWGEWFEWLGNQAEKIKYSEVPAHIRYKDWRP